MMDVQLMLTILGEEGVYELYRTKGYKRLNKELLFGVYTYVLTNIRLHREYKKTKQDEVSWIDTSKRGEVLYDIKVTRKYNILGLGKDHYYEFLTYVIGTYVIGTYVKFYKGLGVSEVIQHESVIGRNLTIRYPAQDIVNVLVYLRAYYGRYSGQEEMECMIKGLLAELYSRKYMVKDNDNRGYNTIMLRVNVWGSINGVKWDDTMVENNGKVTIKRVGFTGRDKAVYELYSNARYRG